MENGRSIQIVKKPVKKKRRNKSDLGEDFIAPDGGWAWLVAIAAGTSILVSFPILQQLGILFIERFKLIGISVSQITTIINTQQGAATCTGLLNGPIFRRFTFRQVAFVGSILMFTGLLVTVFADSFIFYFLTISFLYGVGRGLMFSASNIAVNTYFKAKRRSATACQYTVSGLGPIFLPYISTYFMNNYGVAHAVLFYAGLSLHNFACSLIYQPVKWHTKDPIKIELDQFRPLYEDVYSGLEAALDSSQRGHRRCLSNSIYENAKPMKVPKNSMATFAPLMAPSKKIPHPEEKHFLEKPREELYKSNEKKRTFLERTSKFLELDLLKDFTYVNLSVGLTIIHFVEINFAFLTPFILHDYHCDSGQIAMAMSLLAFCDIVMRMLIPIITRNLKLSNKVILVFGILCMSLGRTILVFDSNYTLVLVCFGWMGLSKAIRVVFWNLVLPSHVPLKKLPAAIGLQRTIMGLFVFICGPFIGLIRDASKSNYGVTLLFMNGLCCFVAIAWLGEDVFRWFKRRTKTVSEKKVDQTTK